MPRGDRTGPMGAGPMTGRGLGYCAGISSPGYAYRGWYGYGAGRGGRPWGGGRGRAWGGGRGYGHGGWGDPGWGWAPSIAYERAYCDYGFASVEHEKSYLREELKGLQEEMDALTKHLNELESEKKDKES